MRAVVQSRYGPAEQLTVQDVPMPEMAADEVLVRVRAASVHPDIWHVVSGTPYILRAMGAGLRAPKNHVPGTDLSGRVTAVGNAVSGFAVGDDVFGETIRGIQWINGGAYAEYAAVPVEGLALKPVDVTHEQAAAVPTAGLIALQNLTVVGRPGPGQRLLVNGAAGGVGGAAVQLGKALGAHVTGVDRADKRDIVLTLGADRFIDYHSEDFTQGPERYDRIFDVPGNHSFSQCRRVLTPDGGYVLIGHDQYGKAGRRWFGSIPTFARLMVRTPFTSQLPSPFSSQDKRASMEVLRGHLAAGRLTPVIDRTFGLDEVPEAIRYLADGRARGRVVITVDDRP